MFGYHGHFLRIDVTGGTVERLPFPDDVLRQYLGGSGLGTWLLLHEGRASADPLDPASPLIFAFSSLVGSGFAIAGKQTGADAFVIVGRAAELSVLVIDDGRVRLEPAADLHGATCGDAERALRDRLGAEYRIASIGPAGESLVRYATISHDGRHAGRGGSGAVLGSKNIKAIAVRGTERAEWAHPKELVALSRDLSKRSFGPATAKYRELGTATNLLVFNRFGSLPTRNFQ